MHGAQADLDRAAGADPFRTGQVKLEQVVCNVSHGEGARDERSALTGKAIAHAVKRQALRAQFAARTGACRRQVDLAAARSGTSRRARRTLVLVRVQHLHAQTARHCDRQAEVKVIARKRQARTGIRHRSLSAGSALGEQQQQQHRKRALSHLHSPGGWQSPHTFSAQSTKIRRGRHLPTSPPEPQCPATPAPAPSRAEPPPPSPATAPSSPGPPRSSRGADGKSCCTAAPA